MSYLLDDNTICLLHCDDVYDYYNNATIKNNSVIELVDGKFDKALSNNTTTQPTLTFNNAISSYFPNNKIYTVDFWYKVEVGNPTHYVLRATSSQSSYLDISISSSSSAFTLSVNSTSICSISKNDYLDSFIHIAISSDGTNTYCFINGQLQNKTVSSRNLCSNSAKELNFIKSDGRYPIIIDEFRISNVCRYTESFTPNDRPYSSPMHPNILNSTELLCSIINEMPLDTLEVYVNDVLDKTYNSLNANSITIHKYNLNLINASDNTIKVVGYKEGVEYPVEFEYKYLPPLSSIASLNTIINRLQSLLERQENENSIFISILKDKGVTDDLEGLRYEELMEYVRCLGVYTPPNKPVVTDKPVITGIETAFSQYKIYVDTKGLITEDTRVDLYIDDTLHSDRTFSVSGGYVNFNTISSDDVLLNKEIYLDFRNGITTEKYLVNLITLSIESIAISTDI